ncbi:MAG: hypothetical protein JO250_17370 [Armatimonadetes bacterium]|nr:hypothetical protein [Armatimonadota bacterium]
MSEVQVVEPEEKRDPAQYIQAGEVGVLARVMAGGFRRMVEFYKREADETPAEAVALAQGDGPDRERYWQSVRERPAELQGQALQLRLQQADAEARIAEARLSRPDQAFVTAGWRRFMEAWDGSDPDRSGPQARPREMKAVPLPRSKGENPPFGAGPFTGALA